MKISGFSMCRNADSLYYPFLESIKSALPLVDEFVVAVGIGNPGDRTLDMIREINDPKIKVIETDWDLEAFPNGTVHAQQTDLAKSYCTGDWLLYLQADEVLHESDHGTIREACADFLDDNEVEGFLMDYIHFWGDYQHCQNSHAWYYKEIRVIRNVSEIHSWQSAQSFRKIPDFDGRSYRLKKGTYKLNVVKINATIYHYGWVRPPDLMVQKMNELDKIHSHKVQRFDGTMNYGDLSELPVFKGTHPAVMKQKLASLDWTLNTTMPGSKALQRQNHWKYRLLTWIEINLLAGRRLFAFKNYRLLRMSK